MVVLNYADDSPLLRSSCLSRNVPSGLGDSDVVTQVVRFTVQSLRVKTVDHIPEALVSCDSNYRIESRDT